MNTTEIENIIHMRIAVYAAGVKAGVWLDLNQIGASDMMNYLFPKSGRIAFYNLIMEMMRSEHKILTGGVFYLYKMPVQVEKEVSDYLRNHEIDFTSMSADASEYLANMDSIPTDHSFDIVRIGSFADNAIDDLLRLCASHYRYSFDNNVKSYPFF